MPKEQVLDDEITAVAGSGAQNAQEQQNHFHIESIGTSSILGQRTHRTRIFAALQLVQSCGRPGPDAADLADANGPRKRQLGEHLLLEATTMIETPDRLLASFVPAGVRQICRWRGQATLI